MSNKSKRRSLPRTGQPSTDKPVLLSLRPHGQRSARRYAKRDWEKLYRAAVLESDRSRLRQRIEDAEGAILERSQELERPPGNHDKEQLATQQALHILRWLRQNGDGRDKDTSTRPV